jgi:predicted lipoprotein with Yx(FWY)xxD motif
MRISSCIETSSVARDSFGGFLTRGIDAPARIRFASFGVAVGDRTEAKENVMLGRAIRWALPIALLAPIGVGVAVAATGSAHSSKATVKAVKNAKFGTVLASSSGRTLYRYTLDRKGVNNCTKDATCAKYWPRLLVKGTAKPTVAGGANARLVGTIKQPKGLRQVTYAGYPLYTFAGDKGAGQVKGQGFEKTWYVVNTKGALVKHAVEAMTTTTSSSTPPATTTSGGGESWG